MHTIDLSGVFFASEPEKNLIQMRQNKQTIAC